MKHSYIMSIHVHINVWPLENTFEIFNDSSYQLSEHVPYTLLSARSGQQSNHHYIGHPLSP